jgi:DNA-binding CsgD family transcriptional regulator
MAKRGRPPHPDILTPRQWEVLDLVRQGLSNPEIAERLDITRAAVMFHVSEILGKLSLSSREEAAAWDPRQRPEWTPRWDPTRRPAWATALAPIGFFWRGLRGGLAHSAGPLATATSGVLGVAVVAGIATLTVLVMATRGSSNGAGFVGRSACEAGPATTGKIAFLSNRDGNWEIYAMNADGSGQTNLSNNPGDDGVRVNYYVTWSPDGCRLAFFSTRDGNYEIDVMNADGSGRTPLSNNPGDNGVLAWSPDGSRITFNSNRDGNGEIYVMNADGSGQTNLTNNPGEDYTTIWSPVP